MSAPATGPRSVLVVEDDRSVRELLRLHLSNAGYAVLEAVDAEEAAARLSAARPDLMIVDIRLPGQSGLEFVGQLRARDARAIPVIFLTSFDDDANYEAARATTAAEYLVKPVDHDVLLMAVARRLGAAPAG